MATCPYGGVKMNSREGRGVAAYHYGGVIVERDSGMVARSRARRATRSVRERTWTYSVGEWAPAPTPPRPSRVGMPRGGGEIAVGGAAYGGFFQGQA